MLINEEAIYDNKNTEPVYIILMHSGTLLSSIIKNVQGDEFSHSLISFNSKLDPMYSFGNKKDSTIGLNGDPGFVVQNTKDPFYKSKKSYYEVYVMFVSKNDKQKMIQRMKWFKEKDRYLGYDIIGLIKYKLGISSDSNLKKYFCSRFVAEIIGQSGRIDRDASLYSPQDFKDDFSFISLVNKGDDLYKYDYKLTEENLKKVKKGDYSYEKGTRFGHYLEEAFNDGEIINEDDREKGVEFDLAKNTKGLKQKAAIGLSTHKIAKMQNSNRTFSTTSTGKDIVDSKMKSRIETFDTKKAQLILESENIVKEYNKWINAEIDEILKYDRETTQIGNTGEADICAKNIAYVMKTFNIPKEDIKKYIKGTFFFESDNPEEIKSLLTCRINYCNKIARLLSDMLRKNYQILGIDEYIVDSFLQTNKDNPAAIASEIRNLIVQNKNKFITNNGECVDLTSLGFGKIFFSKGDDFTNTFSRVANSSLTIVPAYKDRDNASQAIDSFLQKSTEFDAIIVCHGMSSNDKKYQKLLDKQDKALKKINKLGLEKAPYSTVIDRDKVKLSGNNKERWMMQPIRSDKSDYFVDMNNFLRQLIKEGYKKVLIASCNPGSHKVDKDITDTIQVLYSDYSNLIENASDYEYDLSDDYIVECLDGEDELRSLAESFDLDYDTINIDENTDILIPLSEGAFLDKVKEYAKKALEFVIGIFKKIWGLIKKFLLFIGKKLGIVKNKGNKEIPKIKTKIALFEDAQIQEYDITSPEQLEAIAKKSCDSISKELKKVQNIQVNATKRLSEFTQKLQDTKPNNESSLLELSFMKKSSKYVNDDYNREKGLEFDFKKNAGKDKELNYLRFYTFGGEDKWSTTSMGKDMIDSTMQQRLETFDQEITKQILEAEDIIKAYNDWIEGELDKIQAGVEKVKYTNKKTKQKYFQTEPIMDDPNGAVFAARYVQALANDLGIDKSKVREFIKGVFFYTTDNPEEIRKLLEARLLYSRQTVQILTEVVDKNAEILGLTDKTAKSLIKKMNNDKTMNKSVAEIKKAIIKNRSKFLTNNGECIDLTSIGGGKIFFTGPAYKTLLTPYLRELEKSDPDIDDAYSALDIYFQKAMVYDCIVFAHGADFNGLQYLITNKLNKWALEKIDPEQRQYYSDLDMGNKTMDKNNQKGLFKKRWMMEPIRSDKSDYFNDMNSFVKQLLKEGHRKILIATCNPGNYALSPEVREIAKKVKAKIIYSDYSTLIESYDYDDNDLRSIAESVGIDYDVVLDGENELRKLSESFDIDYDNLDEIVNINESDIIRNIKDYSKKILASIISIFKTGWSNIKNFIRFSGSKLSNSKEEIYTVRLGLIFPDERNVGVFTISSPIELRKWATKSCDSIEYELRSLQSNQLQSVKDIINFKDFNNESTLLSESLNEFLMNGMTIDEALSMNEAKLDSKERKALSDDEFGLPEKRKFPLNDKKHVLLAIKFFNRCDKKDQEELAKNIFKAMKKYDIPMDAIGKNNKLRNYMKESVKESTIGEMYPGNPIVGLNTEKEMIVDNMMNNAFTSLEIDEDIIEKCLRATTEVLMNNMDNFYVPYIPYIQEHSNMDMNIGFYKDLNGIFVMNESTGLRSPSYKEVDDIDDRTILYITNGELNDSKLNDL